ncbi:hypothetical protein LQW54_011945 [Pestalotiopsis sp. IQ-011]
MDHTPLPKSPVPRTGQETLIIFGAIIVALGIVMALIDTCTTPRGDPAQGDEPDNTTRGFWADVRYFLLACVFWTAFLPFGATVGLLATVLIVAADSYTPEDPSPPDVEAGPDMVQTSEDHRRNRSPAAHSVSPVVLAEKTRLMSETSPPPTYSGVGAPVI